LSNAVGLQALKIKKATACPCCRKGTPRWKDRAALFLWAVGSSLGCFTDAGFVFCGLADPHNSCRSATGCRMLLSCRLYKLKKLPNLRAVAKGHLDGRTGQHCFCGLWVRVSVVSPMPVLFFCALANPHKFVQTRNSTKYQCKSLQQGIKTKNKHQFYFILILSPKTNNKH